MLSKWVLVKILLKRSTYPEKEMANELSGLMQMLCKYQERGWKNPWLRTSIFQRLHNTLRKNRQAQLHPFTPLVFSSAHLGVQLTYREGEVSAAQQYRPGLRMEHGRDAQFPYNEGGKPSPLRTLCSAIGSCVATWKCRKLEHISREQWKMTQGRGGLPLKKDKRC